MIPRSHQKLMTADGNPLIEGIHGPNALRSGGPAAGVGAPVGHDRPDFMVGGQLVLLSGMVADFGFEIRIVNPSAEGGKDVGKEHRRAQDAAAVVASGMTDHRSRQRGDEGAKVVEVVEGAGADVMQGMVAIITDDAEEAGGREEPHGIEELELGNWGRAGRVPGRGWGSVLIEDEEEHGSEDDEGGEGACMTARQGTGQPPCTGTPAGSSVPDHNTRVRTGSAGG